jgi:hypothetical protein
MWECVYVEIAFEQRPTQEPFDGYAAAGMRYRIPSINLDAYQIDATVVALVPRELCELHHVIPVRRVRDRLIVAMVDPTKESAIQALEARTGYPVDPSLPRKRSGER